MRSAIGYTNLYVLRPIYTVQLCRMRCAYDKSTTRIVSCKSNLQLACDCRVRHEECRGLLKHVLKPYDNRADRQFYIMEIVCDFSMTRAARAIKIACDNRVVKCDVTKRWICEIMQCDCIFGKSMMKNAQSPKMSCLLQFAAEIWAFLGPIISIQNLLILHWVLTKWPKGKLEGFVWRWLDLKMSISQPQIAVSSSFLGIGHCSSCSFQMCHRIP